MQDFQIISNAILAELAKWTRSGDGVAEALFEKALAKAETCSEYRAELESVLKRPGELALNGRELFSHWGSWLDDPRQETEPHYPFREGVNRFDEVNHKVHRLLNDVGLTADMLDERYNPHGEGEYPDRELGRERWIEAVSNEETLSGYWDWVSHKIKSMLN